MNHHRTSGVVPSRNLDPTRKPDPPAARRNTKTAKPILRLSRKWITGTVTVLGTVYMIVLVGMHSVETERHIRVLRSGGHPHHRLPYVQRPKQQQQLTRRLETDSKSKTQSQAKAKAHPKAQMEATATSKPKKEVHAPLGVTVKAVDHGSREIIVHHLEHTQQQQSTSRALETKGKSQPPLDVTAKVSDHNGREIVVHNDQSHQQQQSTSRGLEVGSRPQPLLEASTTGMEHDKRDIVVHHAPDQHQQSSMRGLETDSETQPTDHVREIVVHQTESHSQVQTPPEIDSRGVEMGHDSRQIKVHLSRDEQQEARRGLEVDVHSLPKAPQEAIVTTMEMEHDSRQIKVHHTHDEHSFGTKLSMLSDRMQGSRRAEESTEVDAVQTQIRKIGAGIKSIEQVIFYHIYIPMKGEGDGESQQQRSLQIVHEQLQQLATTPDKANAETKTVVIYYNVVGASDLLTSKLMNRWCRESELECHLLQQYGENQSNKWEEMTTLQNVYQHCDAKRGSKDSHSRVAYMHNKGSHHPSALNEQWRYLMTEAIGRPECWPEDDKNANDNGGTITVEKLDELINGRAPTCNVCGLYLTTDRGLYMSGNIWTADCGYVQQLIEPQQYRAKMEQLAKEAFSKRLSGDFIMTQYPNDEPSFFGVGRYAAEWWIGSHPSLQVCDFSPSLDSRSSSSAAGYDRTKDFLNFVAETGKQRQEAEQQRQPYTPVHLNFTQNAPHFTYKLPKPKALKTKLAQDPTATKREYFLLPGLLYKWINLYQKVPPQDSWVWRHYPEGEWWREAASKHNTKVLQAWMMKDEPGTKSAAALLPSKVV